MKMSDLKRVLWTSTYSINIGFIKLLFYVYNICFVKTVLIEKSQWKNFQLKGKKTLFTLTTYSLKTLLRKHIGVKP